MIDELLAEIARSVTRERVYLDARDFVKARLGTTKNACATTASFWLQRVGLLDSNEVYMWTSALSERMELAGCTRVERIPDIRPGDIVFTLDRNGNGAPDHVFIATSKPDHKNKVLALDNLKGGKPYRRNLSVGGYTPMWYALRLPCPYPVIEGTAKYTALQQVLKGLRQVYAQEWVIPREARKLLNQFRNHAFLKNVKL